MDFELRPTLPPPTPIDPLLKKCSTVPGSPLRTLASIDASIEARSTPVPRHRQAMRLNAVVLALASILGLWAGLGAASVSPVAPRPAAVAARPIELPAEP
jgi:hypothetical protein